MKKNEVHKAPHLGPPFIKGMSKLPPLAILGNQLLFALTFFFLALGIFRLLFHLVWETVAVPPIHFFAAAVGIIIVLFFFTLNPLLAFLGPLCLLLCASLMLLCNAAQPDALYQAISDWCFYYAKPDNISDIFMAMGIVNFSFAYVISARDKQFYGIPLSDVIQEQFPMHGVMFVLYTLLTLIGLYSSGMEYNIVALVCLCGALLAFLSTCIMAFLFTFSHELKQVMVEYYLSCPAYVLPFGTKKVDTNRFLNRALASADYVKTHYRANGTAANAMCHLLWEPIFEYEQQRFESDKIDEATQINMDGIDVLSLTRLFSHASMVWRHLLQGLQLEQQCELICQVLQSIPICKEKSFPEPEDNDAVVPDPLIPKHIAVPLCGLVSYLRGKDAVSLPSSNVRKYWRSCQQCLNMFYHIYMLYPGAVIQINQTKFAASILQHLFLLMESTLLIEISSLEKDEFGCDSGFWAQLTSLERLLHLTPQDCSKYGEYGLSTISTYKINWFHSRQGMLDAYLTYRRLFDMLDQSEHSAAGKEMR